MRVTPSAPSPRGSISTASHFSSQAQTPIQGAARAGRAVGRRTGGRGVVLRLRTESSFEGHALHRLVFWRRSLVLICSYTCFLGMCPDLGWALRSFTQQTLTDTHHGSCAVPGGSA